MVEVEEVKDLKNYLIQGVKAIQYEGRTYRVSATLQIFIDDEGQIKFAREV